MLYHFRGPRVRAIRARPRKAVDRNLKDPLGQSRNPGSCPILRSSRAGPGMTGVSPCAGRIYRRQMSLIFHLPIRSAPVTARALWVAAIKTTTSSLLWEYEKLSKPLPCIGSLRITVQGAALASATATAAVDSSAAEGIAAMNRCGRRCRKWPGRTQAPAMGHVMVAN
jgi:hypothetical protein